MSLTKRLKKPAFDNGKLSGAEGKHRAMPFYFCLFLSFTAVPYASNSADPCMTAEVVNGVVA